MNIQTEHLPDHTVRLSVEVAPERVEKAMQVAARRIAGKANIPGFRKGKAPYNVILRYFGAPALLQEAIEDLGDDVYKEALAESGIEPYATAQLEKIETDPTLKLAFLVPKVPDAELGNYRELRVPYTPGDVTDEMVNRAIRMTQDNRAVVEPADRPAQMGDKVKLTATGTMIHQHDTAHEDSEAIAETTSEPAAETPIEAEASATESEEHAHVHSHEHADPVNEELDTFLRSSDEDFMPGFSEQIVGLKAGEEKSFTLEYPADFADKSMAGHTVNLTVKVEEVRAATVPALNDEFASQVSEGKLPTLLEYRMDVRKNLEAELKRQTDANYADLVMQKLTEGTSFQYPEAAVEDYTDELMKDLEEAFRERGVTLKDMMRIEGRDENSLRAMYRPAAINRLRQSMALMQLIDEERLSVPEAEIEAEIDRMSAQFGDQAETFKRMLSTGASRTNLLFEMLKNRAIAQMSAIARGENPPRAERLEPTAEPIAIAAESAPAESATPAIEPEAPPAAE